MANAQKPPKITAKQARENAATERKIAGKGKSPQSQTARRAARYFDAVAGLADECGGSVEIHEISKVGFAD